METSRPLPMFNKGLEFSLLIRKRMAVARSFTCKNSRSGLPSPQTVISLAPLITESWNLFSNPGKTWEFSASKLSNSIIAFYVSIISSLMMIFPMELMLTQIYPTLYSNIILFLFIFLILNQNSEKLSLSFLFYTSLLFLAHPSSSFSFLLFILFYYFKFFKLYVKYKRLT